MQTRNLPFINARYWTAIIVASMCGANTGDFIARYFHLGHWGGLLPLAVLFALVIWLEARAKATNEAYYWLAIIILRTGATNFADLAHHDLAISYAILLPVLALAMLGLVAFDRPKAGTVVAGGQKLPATDLPYWITMLMAGILGTAAGDFVADDVTQSTGIGSAVLIVVFGLVLAPALTIGGMTRWWYWAAIVAARTAGTDMGDFLAGRKGLALGLPISTACTAAALVAIIALWPKARMTAGPAATG